MQRIREGLYLLEAARPANSYLIEGGQGLTLVDPGPAFRIAALVEELTQGGFSLDALQRLVLTHAHPEHAGGTAELLRKKRVKVYAHPEDLPVLEGRAKSPRGKGFGGWLRSLPGQLRKPPEALVTVVGASPREPIRGLAQWQVLHLPGHTPGSLGLYDPAHGVVLCGDAVSNLGKLRVADGAAVDPAAAATTLRQLAELDIEVLCPGRGSIVRPRAWQQLEALKL